MLTYIYIHIYTHSIPFILITLTFDAHANLPFQSDPVTSLKGFLMAFHFAQRKSLSPYKGQQVYIL